MITEAEIGVGWPKAKECRQPPEAGRGKEEVFLLEPAEGADTCQHLDLN